MALKTVAPRIDSQMVEFLESNFRSRGNGAEYILDAFRNLYRRTIHELKGEFTHNELSLIIDVFKGSMLTGGIAGQHILMQVVDGMELDGLDKKWGVDRNDFTARVQALSLLDSTCIEIWACGFWQGNGNLDLENYVMALQKEND